MADAYEEGCGRCNVDRSIHHASVARCL